MGKRTRWNSTLPEGEPMKRGPGPKRKTRMKAVNRKRRAKRVTADDIYGKFHRWVQGEVCVIAFRRGAECFGTTDSHHVKSVGSGGKDEANCVPLCRTHHREVHTLGRNTFEERYGIDLEAEAEHLWSRYQQQ